jgi:dUTP pyrophosphatase
MPMKAHETDAGYDLYAVSAKTMLPREVAKFPLRLKVCLPNGYEMQIRTRSGMASKGIFVANSPATIDAGYRGEVCVLLYNSTDAPYVVEQDSRIAQAVFNKLPEVELECMLVGVWEHLYAENSDRKEGGFGSSGV